MSIEIVSARERSTLASSWTEHLCVRHLEHGLFELSIRGYEYLGEYSEYADEDGNVPDMIAGKPVAYVEDGCICGGNLVMINEDDADVVRFRDAGSLQVVPWLKSKNWHHENILAQIASAMKKVAR